MEITWLGHSCFAIKGKEATVVTDPYSPSIGRTLPAVKANVVTVSHDDPNHNFAEGVEGNPKVIRRPGEYEVKGVFINGLANFRDSERGQRLGRNVVYLIEMEGVWLCHLGDIGHVPSSQQVEEMSEVGVLFIPVGGESNIDAGTATEIVRLLDPRVVVPMHYAEGAAEGPDPLDKFMKAMGLKEVIPQPKLTITAATLPEALRVVVLEDQTNDHPAAGEAAI